ncbi:N-acetylmuramoyl-L-alanine amidase, partial [Kineococcus indalonis]|uniref:N-acetylmuramoyl-L-alanine amidase n=1 Tax=Kineococcus indalonis TaxID=2696566 RepID=UPI001411E290
TAEVTLEVPGGSLLGVVFGAGTAPGPVAVRVRRAGAGWGPWTELSPVDSEPDPGTGEAGAVATEPLWTGELGAAQVRVRLRAADLPSARLEVVDPGRWSGDATAAAGARRLSSTSGAQAEAVLEARTAAAVAAPAIRSRADWGADESLRPPGGPAYAGAVRAVVVHHTADPGSYTRTEVPSVIRGMYRYHTVTLGWADLGYNFVVDRFGGIWEGRAGGITRPVVGAHAGGFNTDTFGVSMMGDFTSVAPSAACLESVAQVIAWKLSLHGLPAKGSAVLTSAGGGTARFAAGTTVTLRTINAHRDVGFTACPGNVGFTRMDAIRERVAQILSAGGGAASASQVAAKYAAVGAGVLGAPTGEEGPAKSGGRYRHYQIGSIYFLPATGAHFVRGLIRDKWKAMGWEGSFLGFPTTDEVVLRGGAFTHFQGGSIYWSPRTGARAVRGAIRDKWKALGWETGYLGYPTTDENPLPGGAFTHFQGGSIYWSARTGARAVRGAIRDKWAALGWEAGYLGYPTTDEVALPGGAFTHFQGGSIYFSPQAGARAVRGAIRDKWASLGWEAGRLGYPTSDEHDVAGGKRSDFQGGSITWTPARGAVVAYR